MRVQKEHKAVWVIAILSLVLIYCLRCFDSNLIWYDDVQFLYNRCYQIADCFRRGLYPFLYYNDAGGIGYGSPIFYGQLTLFPFVPFADSAELFIRVYYLCCLLLNFFGFRFFLKRLSEYATLCSVFYLLGMPFIYLYSYSLQAALLGTGFSWFFFGYCIDFFRDRRHFAQVVLMFYLVYQSNMNSAILAVLVCFGLFVAYFDKSRLSDYVRLFLCVLLLLSYNIVNILVHIDSLRLGVGNALFGELEELQFSSHLMSLVPFGEYIVRAALHDSYGVDMCCGLMPLCVLVVFVYFLISGWREQSQRFKVCSYVLLVVAFAGYIAGCYTVWPRLYELFGGLLFFQFPIRYMILLYGLVIAVLSRVVKYDNSVCWILVVCLVDTVLAGPMTWRGDIVGGEDVDYVHYQLYNAEYAGASFVNDRAVVHEYSGSVHSESGAEYAFCNDYNGLSVDCSTNPGVDVLTLPKLYYKGYQVVGSDGEVFEVCSGYSNYCEVDIGEYTGQLCLRYHVPFVVMLFFVVQILCLLALILSTFFKTRFGGGVYRALLVCWYAIQLAVLWVFLQMRVAILLYCRRRVDRMSD